MYQKIVQFIKAKPFKALIILLAVLCLKEVVFTLTFYNDASPVADGFSEANAVRGAVFFHEQGFSKTAGLPVICYGDLLPNIGVGTSPCNGEAYTHYPPGPEYLNWFWMLLFGKGNFSPGRFIHILFSFFAGFFFLKTAFNFVGGGLKGFTLGLMLIFPQMYSNYMHGLHYQGIAFNLLQIQMALTLCYFQKPKWTFLMLFALLGFVQGWMSFDYAFLATLFVIPFFIMMNKEYSVKFYHFMLVGLSSGLSFTAAHALHFLQVVKYLGSVQAAIHDLGGSAAHRATNAKTDFYSAVPKYTSDIGYFTVMRDYLYRVAGRGKYLGINLINFVWIILGLRWVKNLETKRYKFEFAVTTRDLFTLLASVFVASLWSIIMKQHAHIHGFVARHYYFVYFFCSLILVRRTLVLKKN